ncbi:hypothetical protein ACFW16_19670 [Inquilinus sp. NPDC058860]|uniref:hypothetical protein n=1 Tax=Inquilinus sp. NPDC058860 TaxID=3346652 RepID=UPI0036A84FE5
MTTFGAYLWGSGLPGDRTYALAIPELSYPTYKADLTDAKDFYLYSVDVADAKINGTTNAWIPPRAPKDDLYLLPAALSYLAAAAKEAGHVIIDVAVPIWNSIAYESLPFLYINNDKMMLQRKSSRRIQLVAGGTRPGTFDLSLDLRSGDSEIGKSGVFRITESTAIRDYAYLQPAFVHQIQVQRDFVDFIDRIFVANVFGNVKSFGEKYRDVFGDKDLGDQDSAMRQVLALLADQWDRGHQTRGYNIAAALAIQTPAKLQLALLVLNEKKRSRIAHAETRVVSFMNVVCRAGDWAPDSSVVQYISALTKSDRPDTPTVEPAEVLGIRTRFLAQEQDASSLMFLSSFQPCYMCRAEPDGAVIDRISAVNGTAVAPDGRTLRSSFGGTYLSRMEDLYYFDMDSNIFYPRVVVDEVATGDATVLRNLVQVAAAGFVSPQGQPVFGPVAIGNAKEDYASDAARRRIANSSFLPVVQDGSLSFVPDRKVSYEGLQPGETQPIGMRTMLARTNLSAGIRANASLTAAPEPAVGSGGSGAVPALAPLGSASMPVAPADAAPEPTADAPPAPDGGTPAEPGRERAPGLTDDQIRALQRAAVLLGTLGRS